MIGWYKKDVTPLLTHWCYVFLVLIHLYMTSPVIRSPLQYARWQTVLSVEPKANAQLARLGTRLTKAGNVKLPAILPTARIVLRKACVTLVKQALKSNRACANQNVRRRTVTIAIWVELALTVKKVMWYSTESVLRYARIRIVEHVRRTTRVRSATVTSIWTRRKYAQVRYYDSSHIDGLVQDCSISIANVLWIWQSWIKPSILYWVWNLWASSPKSTLPSVHIQIVVLIYLFCPGNISLWMLTYNMASHKLGNFYSCNDLSPVMREAIT